MALWLCLPLTLASVEALLGHPDPSMGPGAIYGVALFSVLTALTGAASVWSGALVDAARRGRWYGSAVLAIAILALINTINFALSNPGSPAPWLPTVVYAAIVTAAAAWSFRRLDTGA
jgi:hypothetical protein